MPLPHNQSNNKYGTADPYVENNTYIQDHARDIFDIHIPRRVLVSGRETMIGFIIYFAIVVVTIPAILFHKKAYDILEVYLPNVDLIANLLSYRGGPLASNIFRELYLPTPTTLEGFLSQSAVNYLALLGVTYIIARETKLSGSIAYGWSAGFLMIVMTYLLPSQFISELMDKVYYSIRDGTGKTTSLASYIPALIAGIIASIAVVLSERALLMAGRKHLATIASWIISLPQTIS